FPWPVCIRSARVTATGTGWFWKFASCVLEVIFKTVDSVDGSFCRLRFSGSIGLGAIAEESGFPVAAGLGFHFNSGRQFRFTGRLVGSW
ncbi:MAG: hypothetical protein PVJ71_04710, partial [Lysobacterales bacterium]